MRLFAAYAAGNCTSNFFMRKLFTTICLFVLLKANGQELYVFSEPASNMPAHSISTKLTGHFVTKDNIYGRF
jgi:hypothetical protein